MSDKPEDKPTPDQPAAPRSPGPRPEPAGPAVSREQLRRSLSRRKAPPVEAPGRGGGKGPKPTPVSEPTSGTAADADNRAGSTGRSTPPAKQSDADVAGIVFRRDLPEPGQEGAGATARGGGSDRSGRFGRAGRSGRFGPGGQGGPAGPGAGDRRAGAGQGDGVVVRLEQVSAGRAVCHASGGAYWLVDTPLSECPDGPAVARAFAEACRDGRSGWHCHCRPLVPASDQGEGIGGDGSTRADLPFAAEQIVLVDLETTGLSSTPLFLIGALLFEHGRAVVRQYFARNYAEERAVLAGFAEHLTPRRLLVTFNGKSFDWPYLVTRSAATGVSLPDVPAHLDMLHVARRCWKHRLPNCRLQTLERYLCGRSRQGDIPGCAIPDAYHHYVHTGHAAHMAEVLHHNLLDLLTLLDLCARLPATDQA